MESVRNTNAEVDRFVLITDECGGFINKSEEIFRIIELADLKIPQQKNLCFYYNLVEFATAVKPAFLKHLFNEGYEEVIYFDPDILVLQRLDPLYESLVHSMGVVTPHTSCDFPDDGCWPDDRLLLRFGVFNLGFLAVKNCPQAWTFLDWWDDKLRRNCLAVNDEGFFVDQKYIDIAYWLFPGLSVEKGPGFNLGYWNLHERMLTKVGSTWLCNNEPLVFCHFSGLAIEESDWFSKHSKRFSLALLPQVSELCQLYRKLVVEAGYERTKNWAYSWNVYADGSGISEATRRRYLDACKKNRSLPDPFASKTVMTQWVGETEDTTTADFKRFTRQFVPPFLWSVAGAIKGRLIDRP